MARRISPGGNPRSQTAAVSFSLSLTRERLIYLNAVPLCASSSVFLQRPTMFKFPPRSFVPSLLQQCDVRHSAGGPTRAAVCFLLSS